MQTYSKKWITFMPCLGAAWEINSAPASLSKYGHNKLAWTGVFARCGFVNDSILSLPSKPTISEQLCILGYEFSCQSGDCDSSLSAPLIQELLVPTGINGRSLPGSQCRSKYSCYVTVLVNKPIHTSCGKKPSGDQKHARENYCTCTTETLGPKCQFLPSHVRASARV